ncbi:P-loop containing nucleoside triphosphate hydrolase protein [Lasiosphaeria hispida]|uniref:P-loop containing nucleoside triphosphate hydrolase protein n=1 Tax=Lasiosphaeria hispida TaxID=260671 RepID=A0AAJ0HH16_9PEZI|nr:P-loop containing nucleoside triphosphate hydrolase protein [Lasiosphaeria hispida]
MEAKPAGTEQGRSLDGLGNHIYLEKQDKLRDIGIDIHTSQIVVVGGQSSGKSSLLESLTGFSFPRGQGLCTRYATQITLRRNPVKSVVISITPRADADQFLNERLRAFRRELEDFENQGLTSVIEEANTAMGIRSGSEKNNTSLPMFSNDILKIEISGPKEPHLTVIDVPGLFQVTEEGHTTDLDKRMVECMVRRYMENERTIVLTVMSCLADRATEGVLQLAKSADPGGQRTVGVLTKADLVQEKAVHQSLLKKIQDNSLKLGYFIVRNRGADEGNLGISQCRMKEVELFARPEWAGISALGRAGVETLKVELQYLLTNLAKQELPKQRAEVAERLEDCRNRSNAMGPSRADASSQRGHLIKIASEFQHIILNALDARYDNNPVLRKPENKIITHILNLHEGFSELIWKKGHTTNFVSQTPVPQAGVSKYEEGIESCHSIKDESTSLELRGILNPHKFTCAEPSGSEAGEIMDKIDLAYTLNRGPEIGTFGGSLLAVVFREQAKKWEYLSDCHTSAVILRVHVFIKGILENVIPDRRLRDELWETVLVDRILRAYRLSLDHVGFLAGVELNGRLSTYNHYFSDNLQKTRLERFRQALKDCGKHGPDGKFVSMNDLDRFVENKSNTDQVKEDIHDILESYYKVARKRFVDAVCRQAIDHFLLDAKTSPLKVLTPELIAELTDEQLDRIAGEDAVTRRERERLYREIKGLEAAMAVLNS